MKKIKTYTELLKFLTYEDRLTYLQLDGVVGKTTFGFDRYLNQDFYRSREWKQLREQIFVRDLGCDLAIEDRPIMGRYLVHHMNPLTSDDIIQSSDLLLNPEYLITVDLDTHNCIHYGGFQKEPSPFVERTPYDMCPWRKM